MGTAYAAVEVLVAAIEKAGSLDRTAIRDAVRDIDIDTVVGRIRFSEKGEPLDRMIFIGQWMNKDLKLVWANAASNKYGDQVPTVPFQWQTPWSER